jgi:hypothetical protein
MCSEDIEVTLRSLKSRGFKGFYAENREEAKGLILRIIPKEATVGVGDSTTLKQIGVIEELIKRGTTVFDGYFRGISREEHLDMLERSAACDVFLTGTNAVTLDGRLVNVDAVGNRVSGIFFGHKFSVIVIGKNKLVKDLDEAFYRIRKLIAPTHVRLRVELSGKPSKAPCVITGRCTDCRSNDRLCNIFTIIEGKPLRTDINVVIVNEDLGLSWNEAWSEERISRIIDEYKKYVWLPPT